MPQVAVIFPTTLLIVQIIALVTIHRQTRDHYRTTCGRGDRPTQLTEGQAHRIVQAVTMPVPTDSYLRITSRRISEIAKQVLIRGRLQALARTAFNRVAMAPTTESHQIPDSHNSLELRTSAGRQAPASMPMYSQDYTTRHPG